MSTSPELEELASFCIAKGIDIGNPIETGEKRFNEMFKAALEQVIPVIEAHTAQAVQQARVYEVQTALNTTRQVWDTRSPFANITNIENNVLAATSNYLQYRLATLSTPKQPGYEPVSLTPKGMKELGKILAQEDIQNGTLSTQPQEEETL